MKLKLRIGRPRTQACDPNETRIADEPADRAPEAQPQPQPARTIPTARTPPPPTPSHRTVRAGSFCRATEVGQTAVTEAGRAVLAIPSGRCGRWVYA
ncbi:hypothetical protein Caci_3365 [Catenulispora acidiphila DSM 44928]|uniref:Uncharacterized protein n=1 Tax=Catenulispora acidiphila (strain DSM 44928 / JCM 14897 / NBRC 102108 / NRRL B-24433 / ID139908) TaxID=479433 RepID=C7Q7S9_CATAD|nr:hypothetical protein [Catenulispora acidiphila]ACU72272.1 hypothetical protein Caci_3365 [Catenulispora acidiphila DSM 44928]